MIIILLLLISWCITGGIRGGSSWSSWASDLAQQFLDDIEGDFGDDSDDSLIDENILVTPGNLPVFPKNNKNDDNNAPMDSESGQEGSGIALQFDLVVRDLQWKCMVL